MTGIKGYTPLSQEQKDGMNHLKVMEERVLRSLEEVQRRLDVDGRCHSLAVTGIQQAFMWANRSIAKPGRVELLDDAEDDGA